MKKLLTLTCLIILLQFIHAQSPQALNYQAIARTADGMIIPTQNISVRFSVLDGSVTGTTLYSETHQATTNSYGLFTLSIGKGTPVTSTFPSLNWASGTDKFLKVEIAPGGGSNYQLQGTTQLLSVPFALYSEKTKLLAGNNTINITNGNTIAGNYQAGNGTNITGNVIAHTFWMSDPNGINYQSGTVGIGATSVLGSKLTIQQTTTGGFSGARGLRRGAGSRGCSHRCRPSWRERRRCAPRGARGPRRGPRGSRCGGGSGGSRARRGALQAVVHAPDEPLARYGRPRRGRLPPGRQAAAARAGYGADGGAGPLFRSERRKDPPRATGHRRAHRG